jgi:hypothetical protein
MQVSFPSLELQILWGPGDVLMIFWSANQLLLESC